MDWKPNVSPELRDAASLGPALADVTRVFHVAAITVCGRATPHEIYESNVTGTRNLLEAFAATGVEKFVYTSTVERLLFRAKADCPTNRHSHPSRNDRHYKRSKFEAEQCAMRAAGAGLLLLLSIRPRQSGGRLEADAQRERFVVIF